MKPAVFILPPRESFTADAAGAIAMVVQRLAGATPNAVVIGARVPTRHCEERSVAAIQSSFTRIPYQPATNLPTLIRTLRRLTPRTIEIHQQPRLALILSALFPRTKILLFLHNDPISMRGLKTRLGRRLARARLHRIVCVSHYLASRYMSSLTGPAPSILPNPLTLADLPPHSAPREQTILFAGRIVPDKAPGIFIAACAMALPALPGWRAVMLGGDRFGPASPETPYVARIRAAASAAGVSFAGPRPHAEVMAAMAAAAIVAVPSIWPEPFGLTALEAIASGAALIATATGGLPEVYGDAALTIPPDDPAALAAAMIRLARDSALRETLAAGGLIRAQNFDTPRIATTLENLRQTN